MIGLITIMMGGTDRECETINTPLSAVAFSTVFYIDRVALNLICLCFFSHTSYPHHTT